VAPLPYAVTVQIMVDISLVRQNALWMVTLLQYTLWRHGNHDDGWISVLLSKL